jgi:putative transposase
MSNVLNSYTRHFNNRTRRRGPLWQSRFKSVEVETDEQLIHLTRYIHLNPTTSNLAKKAEEWEYSSYKEFLGNVGDGDGLCNYSAVLDINPSKYREFVSSKN